MNDEIVASLGELATNLQRSPQFDMLGKLFEQQIAADLLQTKPQETAERERLYALRQGYLAFLSHMAGFAADYAAMTQRPAPSDEDDGIDDPSVHDF